jgi:predicted transcriptional regulator
LQIKFFVLQCIHRVTHWVSAMNEATFTFRVEEELKDSFATAAKARDRTGAQLLRDFMRDFVKKQQEAADHDVWFRRQVQVGLDSANAGNLVSAEDVEAEFAKRREQTWQKLKAKS